MTDWSGEHTLNKIKYSGREIHLQGKFRGFGIERKVGVKDEGPFFYFLGDPHTEGAYLASASDFYDQLLKSIAGKWDKAGTVPIGEVKAPGKATANYRGTGIWDGK